MKICFQHMTYIYQSPFFTPHEALTDISIHIDFPELIAVTGASGSGKTTLIQHFNGLLVPASGQVTINGMDINARETDINKIRQDIGLVYQFPENQFFEETVYKEVAFGPRNQALSDREVDTRVRDSLKQVNLDFERFSKKSPFLLSGGEKRKVAIASILAMEPRVLILDEPTVGLDKRNADQIERIMSNYYNHGRTVIFISHDMDLVARLAKRILLLKSGRLLFDGSPDALFGNHEILEDAGLRLPRVTQVMLNLKKTGYPVRTDVYTLEAAETEVKRVFT